MKMIQYAGRITKSEARKRWNSGKDFIIVPCKCSPWSPAYVKAISGNLATFAIMVDPYVAVGFYTDFDSFVNSFEYYNCNFETGYYAAYYLPKGEQNEDV